MAKTYELTAKQIVEIYDAGRSRGSDEATAFDWGSSPTTWNRFSELEEVLIWGEAILFNHEHDYDKKLEGWGEFKMGAGI